ncbi:AAA family ATPase, partial [Streptococcus pneumoniae]|uniref:AAA family ATPase n=1 Tax=Streptococcus pneumoniae TaxID=1313 RepID=UPI0012D7D921
DRPPRVILCGVSKIGKSTFACQSNKPVVISVKGEEGIDDFDVAKFPVSQSFDDILSWIGWLAENEHDHKTVVIDSLTTLEPLVWDLVCSENQA